MKSVGIVLAALVTVMSWVYPHGVYAADLAAPFSLETTKVLPANVRNPRFIDVFTTIDEKYNGSNASEPLGQPLFKNVTWNQVLQTQTEPGKATKIQGALNSMNVTNLNDSPGNTTGAVSTYANVKVPVLAWGVTSRLTMALAVPIVHVDVNADTGFQGNNEAAQFVDTAGRGGNGLDRNEARTKLNNAVNQKLSWAGMEPIHSFSVDDIGDMQLVAKYLIADRFGYRDGGSFAMKETFILPTGRAPDPDKALDVPTGDGTLGLATQAVYNHELPWDFRFSAQTQYTALMPHRPVMRLPTSDDDPISQDKEELSQDLRGLYEAGMGVERTFPSLGVTLGTGYNAQYLTKAHYQNGQFDPERYAWLANLYPSETLHSWLATASFSTIDWYNHKKFFYPMEVKFGYSRPLAGRNVTTNDIMAGELVVFF